MIEVLQVQAVGEFDGWALGAGASKPAAVMSPDDEDASYIERQLGPDAASQSFTLAAAEQIGAEDVIESVRLRCRARRTLTGGALRIGVRLAGEELVHSQHGLLADYIDLFDTFPEKPGGGGGPWTPADLAAMEVFVRHAGGVSTDPPQQIRVTTLEAIVDFTAAADAEPSMERSLAEAVRAHLAADGGEFASPFEPIVTDLPTLHLKDLGILRVEVVVFETDESPSARGSTAVEPVIMVAVRRRVRAGDDAAATAFSRTVEQIRRRLRRASLSFTHGGSAVTARWRNTAIDPISDPITLRTDSVHHTNLLITYQVSERHSP